MERKRPKRQSVRAKPKREFNASPHKHGGTMLPGSRFAPRHSPRLRPQAQGCKPREPSATPD